MKFSLTTLTISLVLSLTACDAELDLNELILPHQEGVEKGYVHHSIVAKGSNYDDNQFRSIWTSDTFFVCITPHRSMFYDLLTESVSDSTGDTITMRSSDQADNSKIAGFADDVSSESPYLNVRNDAHQNSLRIGYYADSSDAKTLQFTAYMWRNGKRLSPVPLVTVPAVYDTTDWFTNKLYVHVICTVGEYHIKSWYEDLDGVVYASEDVVLSRGISTDTSVKKYQSFFWGGRNDQTGKNNTAPHQVQCNVEFLKELRYTP